MFRGPITDNELVRNRIKYEDYECDYWGGDEESDLEEFCEWRESRAEFTYNKDTVLTIYIHKDVYNDITDVLSV